MAETTSAPSLREWEVDLETLNKAATPGRWLFEHMQGVKFAVALVNSYREGRMARAADAEHYMQLAGSWKRVAERAGACMTCALGAPDIFIGCTDCLNTGWEHGAPEGLVREEVMAEAVASARAEGWQPIETAPRDGTEILLGDARTVCAGFWNDAEECRRALPGWFEESDRAALIGAKNLHPTHWRPLPAPPTTPGGRTDG